MRISRKGFLQIGGLSLLAVAGKTAIGELLGKGEGEAPSQPGAAPATRWAMVVDPGKCRKKDGCVDCINACNKAHNVPVINDPRHEVKWIWKEPFESAFPAQENAYTQEVLRETPVMVFCNHCDNPPCVRVCPTQATWKREDGIVMMDWHRCIGCRYCVAACPYGSRSFNWFDPRPYIPELTFRLSHAHKGSGGEMHLLRRAAFQGPTSSLRGGVSGQGSGVWQPGRPRIGGTANS